MTACYGVKLKGELIMSGTHGVGRLAREEKIEFLNKGVYLILATIDCDGEPCGVPINYIVKDNCETLNNNKVSFNVIANTRVVPNKFGTLWESIFVSGEAVLIDDKNEKLSALHEFFQQYAPGHFLGLDESMERIGARAMVVNITINDLPGKNKK